MEPHPIPQNVTSFQFHLVGDMTLKQFIYLAIGSSIAYLIFVFLAPTLPLLAWPVILISASLGVAFAFLPIGSRPLDYWLGAFLKAIYSPTKRVWKKNGKTFREDALFSSRLVMYLSSLPASRGEQPKAVMPVLQEAQIPTQEPTPPPTPSPDLPSSEELQKTVDLARQAQVLQVRIIQTERALNQIKSETQSRTPIPLDYSQHINKILADLQILVSQASQIKTQLDAVSATLPSQLKEKIKIVVPVKLKQTQLALTTFPNVINGVVQDKKNNYLADVIAVIYDKEGLPVRALKTNRLGQFSGSTPLPNDTYTLELEKDGFTFDILQIELTGQVLPSLLITAK